MDMLIGKRVRTEDGQEGIIVAVEHGGGGPGGWQLLLLTESNRLTAATALNAQLPDPLDG